MKRPKNGTIFKNGFPSSSEKRTFRGSIQTMQLEIFQAIQSFIALKACLENFKLFCEAIQSMKKMEIF